VVSRLNEAMIKSLQQGDVRGKLATEAAEPAGGTPEQFAEHLRQEVKRFTDVVRQTKLQVE
jgi:tripartite-type tricarboxylate transporter receptor subunit TctC